MAKLVRWAAAAVRAPATRSHQRPTDANMVELADLAEENEVRCAARCRVLRTARCVFLSATSEYA